jgi:hypothetical protein
LLSSRTWDGEMNVRVLLIREEQYPTIILVDLLVLEP